MLLPTSNHMLCSIYFYIVHLSVLFGFWIFLECTLVFTIIKCPFGFVIKSRHLKNKIEHSIHFKIQNFIAEITFKFPIIAISCCYSSWKVFFVKSISRIFVKNWFHEKKILSTTIPSTLLIVYPMLTLVEVVACLLARFGVVFCSKAGLSIQVQYTPISRSEVLCYDFVHRKETDRFWSHCKSSSRIVVNKNKLVCWPALKMIFSLFLCFPCAASFICAVCLKITDMPPVQFQNWISKYYVGTSFNSGQNWRKSY